MVTASIAKEVHQDSNAWPDRLMAAMDRLPGGAILAYIALAMIFILLLHLAYWIGGSQPTLTFRFAVTVTAAWSVLSLAVIHDADHTAGRALESFRPALDLPEIQIAELRRELTTCQPLVGWLALPLGAVFLFGTLSFDPTLFGLMNGVPVTDTAVMVFAWFNSVMMVLNLYKSTRDLRGVRHIHARAAHVDLFQPQPLFAFSRLTARIAVFGAGLAYVFLLAFPGSLHNPAGVAIYLFLPPLLLGLFLLPLTGMHVMMQNEKVRLVSAVNARMQAALAALHADQEAGNLTRMDGLNKLLASLTLEHEHIAKIPTWPWQPGTFGTVITALLIPLILFMIQQLLERLIA